ncbi:hypothetical protein AB6A40_008783 [Gnathostoma spinigerum]|uniref:Protein kinase domain-containing protein n=1 Tax=Gnathostoma spinigerum TaxID=75299 RepID=A0ABD6EV65_9BILA
MPRHHHSRVVMTNLPKPGDTYKTKKDKYEIVELVGKGGFGAVFKVKRHSDGMMLAMKCEDVNARKPVIQMDCKVLRGAQCLGSQHFCELVDRGLCLHSCRFLIMSLVGKNLWDLRVERDELHFSLGTALKAAEQSLEALEHLHRVGFLHRDVKPGNFAIGRAENMMNHTIYLIDFGLCRQFGTPSKDIRLPRASAPFRGTTRYAPITALREHEQSRKDDIESWLYVVVEWTSGALPWHKLRGSNKAEVLRWKIDVRFGDALDEFLINCPRREFESVLNYIDSLEYQSIPDYDHIYYCLQHAAKVNNIARDEPLDWDPNNRYHGPQVDLTKRKKEKEEDKKIGEPLIAPILRNHHPPSISNKN